MKDYRNIITLPHPTSRKHKQMPLYERAAQFAPFASLTGFDAQINEKARFVESRPSLSDGEAALLNEQLRILTESAQRLWVRLTVFVPDAAKTGGVLTEEEGEVRRVDLTARRMIFSDRREFALDEIFALVFL